eukprot:m.316373 g.316373  ORF g.316373 m.316373 type:complete len:52 (+) comp928385_c0_seq1:70-225(+)
MSKASSKADGSNACPICKTELRQTETKDLPDHNHECPLKCSVRSPVATLQS